MESTEAGTNGSPRKGLRERLKATEPPPLSAETLDRLSKLPERLLEMAKGISRELDETADRITWRFRDTATEAIQRSERQASDAIERLKEQQHALDETERNLAYTVERLRRQADRAGTMQTAAIVLALIAGMLG
jgi:chromosome segregation ATPase